MARRALPKRPPVQMRNVLVELPEDKLLALQAKAGEAGVSVRVLVARIVTDWLGS